LSSISHISFCIISLSTLKERGILASYILSLAHGFVSPIIFYLIGNSASIRGRRNMVVIKSIGTLRYRSMVIWFLICSWNIGCPPSINLVSEILNLLILISAIKEMLILIIFIRLFTSFYSVIIFIVKHGSQRSFIRFNFNLSYRTSMWLQMWSFMALSLIALANFFALFR
jgi:NADH:ubiquinone oxidoreductase subunit 4 (subunit M)